MSVCCAMCRMFYLQEEGPLTNKAIPKPCCSFFNSLLLVCSVENCYIVTGFSIFFGVIGTDFSPNSEHENSPWLKRNIYALRAFILVYQLRPLSSPLFNACVGFPLPLESCITNQPKCCHLKRWPYINSQYGCQPFTLRSIFLQLLQLLGKLCVPISMNKGPNFCRTLTPSRSEEVRIELQHMLLGPGLLLFSPVLHPFSLSHCLSEGFQTPALDTRKAAL